MVKLPYPDNFDPSPTVFAGGIKRMLEIWETLRDQNAGGYGGGVVQQIGAGKHRWQIHPDATRSTSCSPFTATVIGMLLDPSRATSGDSFQPVYDRGATPLPHDFYSMHQGNYFGARPGYQAAFAERGWDYCNDSAGSVLFHNLGYSIEARDLRRGDFVGIDWSNNGGHAVFVWDVHLDGKGEVDAFCFVSANGLTVSPGKYAGNGVSIGGCGKPPYVTGERGSLKRGFATLFEDRASQIKDAEWFMVPGRSKSELDRATFKDPGPPRNVPDHTDHPPPPKAKGDRVPKWPFHVRSLKAVRLWGVFPPDRAPSSARQGTDFDQAQRLGYEHAPESYATGKGSAPAVHIERAPVTVHKGEVDTVKQAPPRPAPQHPRRPAEHQHFVEDALRKLSEARWLEHHPGDPDQVNDGQTKAAVREFQTRFDAPPVDGIAGPITRRALRKALDDLAAGRPAPHQPPRRRRPRLDRVAWLQNRVEVGGATFLSVHGEDLDLVETFDITLRDRRSGREARVGWPLVLVNDIGTTPVVFPPVFTRGAEIVAQLSGTGSEGTRITYDHAVPVTIGEIARPAPGDWPWDEQLWTQKMRDIIAELRATPAPAGPFERFEITQYGVKEKLDSGDVEVRSDQGQVFGKITRRSLMLADIEGTMRLDGRILNIVKSGNVYEDKAVIVDGVKVIKKKPSAEKFDPARSRWTDVTARAPWGAGSVSPLVPFRTVAINPRLNPHLHYKKIYIKQLDGLQLAGGERHNGVCVAGDTGGMRQAHCDLFVGREDHHISMPSVGHGGGTICEVQILEECAAARSKK